MAQLSVETAALRCLTTGVRGYLTGTVTTGTTRQGYRWMDRRSVGEMPQDRTSAAGELRIHLHQTRCERGKANQACVGEFYFVYVEFD